MRITDLGTITITQSDDGNSVSVSFQPSYLSLILVVIFFVYPPWSLLCFLVGTVVLGNDKWVDRLSPYFNQMFIESKRVLEKSFQLGKNAVNSEVRGAAKVSINAETKETPQDQEEHYPGTENSESNLHAPDSFEVFNVMETPGTHNIEARDSDEEH